MSKIMADYSARGGRSNKKDIKIFPQQHYSSQTTPPHHFYMKRHSKVKI